MDIGLWMDQYVKTVCAEFGSRVVFLGLQGSQARGEATAESDIDAVAIFDHVDADTLRAYRDVCRRLPESEKLCGFVCGQKELDRWPAEDLIGLMLDTLCFHGSLEYLGIRLTPEVARAHVLMCAGNLYHMCAQAIFLDKPCKWLRKQALFTLRAHHYCQSGMFVHAFGELLLWCEEEDAAVFDCDADKEAETFLAFASRLIQLYGKDDYIPACPSCGDHHEHH